MLAELKGRGQMRRVAAVLFHRKMGFRANGMGVWRVPEDRIDEVGPQMGSYRNVSHCYLRPTYADWPYNLFTMVHARSMEECEEILDAISEETGIEERTSLYSTKEYKKTRVPYFTAEMDEWGGRPGLARAGRPGPGALRGAGRYSAGRAGAGAAASIASRPSRPRGRAASSRSSAAARPSRPRLR